MTKSTMGKEEREPELKVVDKRRFSSEGEPLADDKEGVKETGPEPERAKKTEEKTSGDREGTQQLPPADFTTFMISLGASALMHLGDSPNPVTKEVEKNLSLARHTIDTLQMIKEKTKGNLTENEGSLLEGLLADLKMRYVKASG